MESAPLPAWGDTIEADRLKFVQDPDAKLARQIKSNRMGLAGVAKPRKP